MFNILFFKHSSEHSSEHSNRFKNHFPDIPSIRELSTLWQVPLLSRDALIEPFPDCRFWANGWCLGADLCWGMGDEY
jgi:hypothetical protein